MTLRMVMLAVFMWSQCSPVLEATTLFFSGDLRTDANVIDCGTGCTLGQGNSDSDYATWAAAVKTFVVTTSTTMLAVSYSFGGGTSLTGPVVSSGGLEPYLSLFDFSGQFLASTFFGTTCPPGANTFNGNCFDVSLDGGVLTPGTYFIALTAFQNMSLAENGNIGALSDGFAGLGNLGGSENLTYAFDVILPGDVPEPGSAALFLIGSAAFALYRRARRTHY